MTRLIGNGIQAAACVSDRAWIDQLFSARSLFYLIVGGVLAVAANRGPLFGAGRLWLGVVAVLGL